MNRLEQLAERVDQARKEMEDQSIYNRAHNNYLRPAESINGPEALRLLQDAAVKLGVRVRFVDSIDGNEDILGKFNPLRGIEVLKRSSKTGMAASLAHELSHAVDRKDYFTDPLARLLEELTGSMTRDETVAESSAFLVVSMLGIDWSEQAAYYIGNGGATGADVRQHAERSEAVAEEILGALRQNHIERMAA